MASERIPPSRRSAYPHFIVVPTRWMDNDLYGHVNNVVYYSWFDTVINRYLIAEGGLDIQAGTTINFAVETGCRYHKAFAYPEDVEAGLRVTQLGRTSVRYEIGLFGKGEDASRADGHFVHVFVERASGRPVEMSTRMRAALERLRA